MMIAMKQHGDGLQHLEEMTIIHIKELLEKLEAEGEKTFDPQSAIKLAIGKLMMTLAYGFGYEEALKRIAEVEGSNIDLLSETGPCMILNFCPPLRFIIPSVKNAYDELVCQLTAYRDIFSYLTDKRREEFDGKNPKIYIDHFLNMLDQPTRIGPGITLILIYNINTAFLISLISTDQ